MLCMSCDCVDFWNQGLDDECLKQFPECKKEGDWSIIEGILLVAIILDCFFILYLIGHCVQSNRRVGRVFLLMTCDNLLLEDNIFPILSGSLAF